jgi:ABC-2 type transport system ATP-binding protein
MVIKAENLCKNYRIQDRSAAEKNGAFVSFFHRKYKTVEALKDVSFGIEEGELVGYIGPNGAGKSTSIKLMCGILSPTQGIVELNGNNPNRNRKANAMNIGVVFGQRTQLWWDLPAKNSFELLKRMYRVSDEDYNSRMSRFNELVNLQEFMDVPVRNLSLGQKMRAEISAAFLHNPSVVFLDEPTIGLDIVSKRNIQEFIAEINRLYHTTIVLTTHDLSDVEALCKRIILIDKGSKLFDGQIGELYSRYAENELLSIKTDKVVAEEDLNDDIFKNTQISVSGDEIKLTYNVKEINHSVLLKKIFEKYNIIDFDLKKTSIEDIIHDLYLFKEYE